MDEQEFSIQITKGIIKAHIMATLSSGILAGDGDFGCDSLNLITIGKTADNIIKESLGSVEQELRAMK